MKLFKPQKIFIERDAINFRASAEIIARIPEVPVEIIENSFEAFEKIRGQADPIGAGKRYLLLAHDKGRSFKPFPESEQYYSCDYYTLHVAEGCDLECSYCILQTYLTNPLLTVYVNVEEMLAKLQNFLNANTQQFFRIGTGQLADSLSLDHITGYTEYLIPFFSKQENAVLELKTKSNNIERLLNLDPNGRIIIGWSMNAEKIQKEEEHKCANLDERLEAAAAVIQAGYRVSFHFDPMIDYPEWEQDYRATIEKIFDRVDASAIAWMSLGCLRFMPSLKPMMQTRFPKSPLPYAEWITGMDGKMRYFKLRRIEIYQKMVRMLRAFAPEATIYLTMESPEVWRRVFGKDFSKFEICQLLDAAVLGTISKSAGFNKPGTFGNGT